MSGFFGKLEAAITPIAKNVERKFGAAYQYAGENLGFAKELTVLPEEYLVAERRVNMIREALQTSLRVYSPRRAFTQRLADLTRHISGTSSDAGKPVGASGDDAVEPALSSPSSEGAREIGGHLVGQAWLNVCGELPDDAYACVLRKYAEAQETLAHARMAAEREIEESVLGYLRTRVLGGVLEEISVACKDVVVCRRRLDSLKSLYRSVEHNRAYRTLAERDEIEDAENKLVVALSFASSLMKSFLEDSGLLDKLSVLVSLEAKYHTECLQSLMEAESMMKEASATHCAIYGLEKQ